MHISQPDPRSPFPLFSSITPQRFSAVFEAAATPRSDAVLPAIPPRPVNLALVGQRITMPRAELALPNETWGLAILPPLATSAGTTVEEQAIVVPDGLLLRLHCRRCGVRWERVAHGTHAQPDLGFTEADGQTLLVRAEIARAYGAYGFHAAHGDGRCRAAAATVADASTMPADAWELMQNLLAAARQGFARGWAHPPHLGIARFADPTGQIMAEFAPDLVPRLRAETLDPVLAVAHAVLRAFGQANPGFTLGFASVSFGESTDDPSVSPSRVGRDGVLHDSTAVPSPRSRAERRRADRAERRDGRAPVRPAAAAGRGPVPPVEGTVPPRGELWEFARGLIAPALPAALVLVATPTLAWAGVTPSPTMAGSARTSVEPIVVVRRACPLIDGLMAEITDP